MIGARTLLEACEALEDACRRSGDGECLQAPGERPRLALEALQEEPRSSWRALRYEPLPFQEGLERPVTSRAISVA
ncbi:hypothetical protein ACPA9J_23265 [Pseudomonas aeruginosa]